MVPANYMVDDSVTGDKAFYTKPTDPWTTGSQIVCPFANGLYNPILGQSFTKNTANNLAFDSSLYGNSVLTLNDGTYSKYIIDWWMKIPSLTGQFGADIEIISFFNNNTPYAGSDRLDIDLDTQTTGSFPLKCNWNINRVGNGNVPEYLQGFNLPLQETMTTITDTNWHHYAWVVDGELNNTTDNKYVRFYVDGELVFNRAKEFRWYLWSDPANDLKYDYRDVPAEFDQFAIGEGYTGVANSYGNTRVCCMKVDQFRISQVADFDGTLIKDAVTPTTAFSEYAEIELPNRPLGSSGYKFKIDGYDSDVGNFSNVMIYMNDPTDQTVYNSQAGSATGISARYFESGNKVRIYSTDGYEMPNSPPTYVTIQAIDSGDNILGMPSEPIKIVISEDG